MPPASPAALAEPRPVTPAEVVSLGCRLNLAEGETIRALAGDRPLSIVNSCAVTAEAVRQSRQAVRRARRADPHAELVVTGCAATLDPAMFLDMPEVDRVVANPDKLLPASWGGTGAAALAVSGPAHARRFVGVQDGCDHDCTFCATTLARGASRSVPADLAVARIAALVEAGAREVVLTGVDLTSYADGPIGEGLGRLVERILREAPALPRLRLSSLDAIEVDDTLAALIAGEPRLMPHLHLSLQSGDDLILKRMKRRHLRADAVALVARLKAARPELAIGADLIAGFPTEGEQAFANTLALLDDCDIVHAHVFAYSPRPGTPAARMPQVDPALARDRASRLRETAAVRKARWLDRQVGTTQPVLVEKPGTCGHAPNFADVALTAPAPVGTIVAARIVAATPNHLIGEPA